MCVCVCEGETGDQNKDAKEKGVREMGRMAMTTRDKKSVFLCVCVCEGETGDQNKDAKPKGVRERTTSCFLRTEGKGREILTT